MQVFLDVDRSVLLARPDQGHPWREPTLAGLNDVVPAAVEFLSAYGVGWECADGPAQPAPAAAPGLAAE